MNTALRNDLVDLFLATGRAHHEAYSATNGEDPDWPIWYAGHLQEPLSDTLQTSFTRSDLVYCVMNANFEHAARAPDSAWPEFYADQFIERYSASPAPELDTLILYHSDTCPYCTLVRTAIKRLGIDVELREVFANPESRDELVQARGRATVPVLRIISPDGEERWMPESRDIVRYLETLIA